MCLKTFLNLVFSFKNYYNIFPLLVFLGLISAFLIFKIFMEDHHHHQGNNNNQDPNSPNHGSSAERSEPVRSRWTPKPEQILILESIFNSGMVNPPKDETVRIRRLLEKFGSVGDANVFYWFQNRRSRSRRRQRQLQASLASSEPKNNYHQASNTTDCGSSGGGGAIPYGQNSNSAAVAMGFSSNNSPCLITSNTTPSNFMLGSSSSSSSSSCGVMGGDGVVDAHFYSIPSQMDFQEIDQSSSVTSMLCPSETSSLPYQSGFITVFINGVPTEVPRGLIDMKAVFGQDVVLIHSSGVPVPINEFGVLMQTLQHGESYFLVSRTV